MSSEVRLNAARSTLLACITIAITNIGSLLLDPRDHSDVTIRAVDAGHLIIALVVAFGLWRPKTTPSLLGCEIRFAIVTLPFVVGMWLPQMHDLERGVVAEPLLAHHFLLLGIAIVTPSWRAGAALIGLFAVHAIVLGAVLKQSQTTVALDHEPWFTLLFALIAALLMYMRARRSGLERRLLEAEERAQTMARVSGLLLALRDRANTPLQTLEVSISLLEEEHPDDPRLRLMRRAFERLAAIQQTLADTKLPSTEVPPDLDVALRALLPGSGLPSDQRDITRGSSAGPQARFQ